LNKKAEEQGNHLSVRMLREYEVGTIGAVGKQSECPASVEDC